MLISTPAVSPFPTVSTGRRLDFEMMPGCFAYIYRRQRQQPWQCVARNACSPYFERSAVAATDSQPEYLICYCDAAGTIKASYTVAATPVASAPASPTA